MRFMLDQIRRLLALVLLGVSVAHADFAWQKPLAEVLPTGDIALAQEPFEPPAMSNPRYIDFDGGDDSRNGRSPATAWKHHPLDPEAKSAAKANEGNPDGYVFKGGITYRGCLVGTLAGTPERPVHLTSLPSWGRGKALISGAEAVPARKWRKVPHPSNPDAEKVWAADLDFSPRAVFVRNPKDGSAEPLRLARSSDWTVSSYLLDEPAEFWLDRKLDGSSTLYLYTSDGSNLRQYVEAARRPILFDLKSTSDVRISNLAFAFTNPYWSFSKNDATVRAAIHIAGGSGSVIIDHCDFSDVNQALNLKAGEADYLPLVAFNDNCIQRTDRTAIGIEAVLLPGDGRRNSIGHVDVLRNSLIDTGVRVPLGSSSHAICVSWPETLHLAGNMLTRTYGAGIFVLMGKPDKDKAHDVPFSRAVIHHNRVEPPLFGNNDRGAIETWQGGPYYIFDNVAHYRNGSFKNYLFNNIALGVNNDIDSPRCNNAAFSQAVPSVCNHFYNNTAHRFAVGSNGFPAGGRQIFAGNVFSDISKIVFSHGPQEEDTDENKADVPQPQFASIGYARNVFAQTPPDSFGVLEKSGSPGILTFDAFRAAARAAGTFASDVGITTNAPLFDGDSLVPLPGSAAIDAGVRPFIPWALGRTVGEWHFRAGSGLDEHWYMTEAYADRSTYYKLPHNDLSIPEGTVAANGVTEDWCQTAVRFAAGPATLPAPETEVLQATSGNKPQSVGTASLIVEAVFATSEPNGMIVTTSDPDAGYAMGLNAAGHVAFRFNARGPAATTVVSPAPVADGRPHHVLAEVDRKAGSLTLFLDGSPVASQDLTPDVRAANASSSGELLVGRDFRGELDFLRITFSSLAESRTSIEELFAWEFDGPFLRDFAGRRPNGPRDAGALER